MKRALVCASLAALLVITSSAAKSPDPTVEGDILTFTLKDFDGNTVSHTDERFKGKVILIDIWGTWCGACKQSIRNLVRLQEKHRDAGLIVIGIAFEDEDDPEKRRELVQKYAKKRDMNYLLLDGGTTGTVSEVLPTLQGFQGYPTMIVIGRDGKVVHANTVFVPDDEPEVERAVEQALAQ